MAHINLLPSREWERERKKKEFLGNLAGVLVLGAVLVLTVILMLASILPASSATAIALIWLLIIPFSYEILAEQETQVLFDLPGVPAGSSWQPRPPRRR